MRSKSLKYAHSRLRSYNFTLGGGKMKLWHARKGYPCRLDQKNVSKCKSSFAPIVVIMILCGKTQNRICSYNAAEVCNVPYHRDPPQEANTTHKVQNIEMTMPKIEETRWNLVSINIYWKLSYVYLVDRASTTVCYLYWADVARGAM